MLSWYVYVPDPEQREQVVLVPEAGEFLGDGRQEQEIVSWLRAQLNKAKYGKGYAIGLETEFPPPAVDLKDSVRLLRVRSASC
jgi:hypothetical protein